MEPRSPSRHGAIEAPWYRGTVVLSLTSGRAADITQGLLLLDQVLPEAFLADKGYDSNAQVATLEERGMTPVIPPKANRREPRKTDFALYRELQPPSGRQMAPISL